MQVQSQIRKIPWRRKWQPTPVFLPGESHRQRSLAGYIHTVHGVAKNWTQLSDWSTHDLETLEFSHVIPSVYFALVKCAFPQCLEYAELFYVSESLLCCSLCLKRSFLDYPVDFGLPNLNLPVKISQCIFCLSS